MVGVLRGGGGGDRQSSGVVESIYPCGNSCETEAALYTDGSVEDRLGSPDGDDCSAVAVIGFGQSRAF